MNDEIRWINKARLAEKHLEHFKAISTELTYSIISEKVKALLFYEVQGLFLKYYGVAIFIMAVISVYKKINGYPKVTIETLKRKEFGQLFTRIAKVIWILDLFKTEVHT